MDSGRYQFHLNDDFIRKTAESDTSVTYYVPAGTQYLFLDQDTGAGADWDVTISNVGAANNGFPYVKAGGDIGGVGNDFDEEWLPFHRPSDILVNLSLALTGDITDSVRLEVWDSGGKTMTMTAVYGTETVWATTTIQTDLQL